MELENKSLIYFCAIYKKPTNKINTNEINDLINSFESAQYILAGDFNCKHTFWGNKENDSEGNKLYKWLCDSIGTHNLNLLKTTGPTCIRTNSESFLDLFVIEDSLNVIYDQNNNELSTMEFDSDHLAVALTITLSSKVMNVEPKKIHDWTKADFKGMR